MELKKVVLLARRSAVERNKIARRFEEERNKITRSFGGERNKISQSFWRKGIFNKYCSKIKMNLSKGETKRYYKYPELEAVYQIGEVSTLPL